MNKYIIVYYDGQGLTIYQDVADELRLHNGYIIKTEEEFWHILKENSIAGLIKCEIALALEEGE